MFFCVLAGYMLQVYNIFSCLNWMRRQYIIQVGQNICRKAEASCFHDTCNFRSEFITFLRCKKIRLDLARKNPINHLTNCILHYNIKVNICVRKVSLVVRLWNRDNDLEYLKMNVFSTCKSFENLEDIQHRWRMGVNQEGK